MVKLSTLSEMFTLYLGGYRGIKILRCSLEDLIAHQKHDEAGKIRLSALYPELVKSAELESERRKKEAKIRCGEMLVDAMNTRPKLLDLVKADSWRGGNFYHQPVMLGERSEEEE